MTEALAEGREQTLTVPTAGTGKTTTSWGPPALLFIAPSAREWRRAKGGRSAGGCGRRAGSTVAGISGVLGLAVSGGRPGTKDRRGTDGGGPSSGDREHPGIKGAALASTRNPEKVGSVLRSPVRPVSNCAVSQGGETNAASACAGSRERVGEAEGVGERGGQRSAEALAAFGGGEARNRSGRCPHSISPLPLAGATSPDPPDGSPGPVPAGRWFLLWPSNTTLPKKDRRVLQALENWSIVGPKCQGFDRVDWHERRLDRL